jgi:osmotically-inducible protein OsmY
MEVSADQIRDHIIRHLKWDTSLKGSNIMVDYVNRKAILSGTVPSINAREAALRDAQSIPGVDRVENRLTVKFDHDHPNKTDQELRSDITTILGCAADVNARDIDVSVWDGIIRLTGTTDAYWKRTRIEELVSSIDGVLDIINEIRIRPAELAPDHTIKKDIVYALDRMAVKELNKIKVDVSDGVVTFSGSVPTWDIYFDIEDTARYTAGVTGIKNELIIE